MFNRKKLTRDYEELPLKRGEVPPYEDIYYLYIELNLGTKFLIKYFNRTSNIITKWLKTYDIVKPPEMWVEQSKNDWMLKYGCDNPQKIKEVQEKTKKTNLEKYGHVCAMQSESISGRIRQERKERTGYEWALSDPKVRAKGDRTNEERYGEKYPIKAPEIQKKIQKTVRAKYGVDNVLQVPEIRKKGEETRLQKYGVRHASQIESAKQKAKQTNLERYGVEHHLQSESQKEKLRKHNQENYNCDYTFQRNDVKNKIKDSHRQNLGVEYPMQSPDVVEKRRENNKSKWGTSNISTKHIPPKILEILESRELLLSEIESLQVRTAKELATRLGVSYDGIKKRLHEHGLWDMLDHYTSSYEVELQQHFPTFTKTRAILHPYEIDLYNESLRFGIEFNGSYWHSDIQKSNNYHQEKTLLAESNGIFLYHIFEYEWLDTRIRPIILSQINNILTENTRVWGRHCKIQEIDYTKCSDFLLENHIQGKDNSPIRYGLFYHDELVSVMTFCKPRFNKKYEWELSRFCCKLNTSVVGGASRLFKHFIRQHNPSSIISYSNIAKTRGNLYQTLGFILNAISSPNYVWIKQNEVLSRYACQKHKLIKDYSDFGSTEVEIMTNRGYNRIYDCGNKVWIWESTVD